MLTLLLADALGGNAMTLIIGVIRLQDWELSSTTLKQLAVARSAQNHPIVNHGKQV